LFVLLLFSKTRVCVVVLRARAVQWYKQGTAQHKAAKQQSNKPKLAEVGNLTDEPTTTWKRTLNVTLVVSLQTRTTALQTKARDYYGRDYNKGRAPEPQLRTERELPTVRMGDTKLRRSYRLNTNAKNTQRTRRYAKCKISPAVRSLEPAGRPGPEKECDSKCPMDAEGPRDVVGHLQDTNVRQMRQRMRYSKSTKFRDRFAPWSQPFDQAPRKTKAGDNEKQRTRRMKLEQAPTKLLGDWASPVVQCYAHVA
jgi:hypothetical protein